MYEFSNEGENIMNEIKNKIITISGEPASGKSTVKKALVKKYKELGYNVHEVSTGDMFREVSIREYKKFIQKLKILIWQMCKMMKNLQLLEGK